MFVLRRILVWQCMSFVSFRGCWDYKCNRVNVKGEFKSRSILWLAALRSAVDGYCFKNARKTFKRAACCVCCECRNLGSARWRQFDGAVAPRWLLWMKVSFVWKLLRWSAGVPCRLRHRPVGAFLLFHSDLFRLDGEQRSRVWSWTALWWHTELGL